MLVEPTIEMHPNQLNTSDQPRGSDDRFLLQLTCGASSTVSFRAVRLRASVWAGFTVHILSKFLGNRLYPVEESETGENMESQLGQRNQ